jgi:hypothetical protein
MSYSFLGFGAAITCPANAAFNPTDGSCGCQPGFESTDPNNIACTPVNVSAPCKDPTQRRNPIDKQCECPTGTIINPDPTKDNCIPGKWFPGCVDAAGNSIPGCYLGMSTTDIITGTAIGLALGVTFTLLLRH